MHSHKSKAYNPCIAKAFFRAGYVEAWGRGIEKICDECEAYGADKPEYIVHSVDIMLILHALRDDTTQTGQITDRTGQKTEQSNMVKENSAGMYFDEKTKEKTREKTREKTKEKTKEKIMGLMKLNPSITYGELMTELSMSKGGIEYAVRKLREAGLIERIGADKGGVWKVKGD